MLLCISLSGQNTVKWWFGWICWAWFIRNTCSIMCSNQYQLHHRFYPRQITVSVGCCYAMRVESDTVDATKIYEDTEYIFANTDLVLKAFFFIHVSERFDCQNDFKGCFCLNFVKNFIYAHRALLLRLFNWKKLFLKNTVKNL